MTDQFWCLSPATRLLLQDEQQRASKLAALQASLLVSNELKPNSQNSSTALTDFRRLTSLGPDIGLATANSKRLASLFPALTQI
jgi:hypothetical protein